MNIDERLEKPGERHAALTQSLELLLIQGRELDKRMDKMDARLGGHLDRLVGVVESLTHAVKAHEDRISGLEGTA